jgi:hypothetical protein
MSMSNQNEKIRANKARYERTLEQVRADGDLSPEGKARKLRPVFEEAKALDSKLRGERMADLREKVRAAERAAFAAPALRGADPALVQLNFRSALDVVEGIVDPSLLARRLDRALLTEDKALAKAVAWRANDLGAAGVVKKYMDTDEAASRKWTAWAEAFAEVEQIERLGESLGFGDVPISEPPEIRGFREAS